MSSLGKIYSTYSDGAAAQGRGGGD